MKSKESMTLDRVLSRLGIASRTLARQAIAEGRIKVNGGVVRDADLWIHIDTDVIHLNGKRLRQARKIYLLFCKPKGVITSHGDPSSRRTVYDYLDRNLHWVSPIGRLDKDSSGLLLLTNDTEFANFVTDPDSRVEKAYVVKLNGLIGEESVVKLAAGVRLKRGYLAQPVSVKHLGDRGKYSWLEIVLTEGKNREVRRMVETLGFKVLKLVRTRIGPWSLEGLEVGRYRELSPAEIGRFRQQLYRRDKLSKQV